MAEITIVSLLQFFKGITAFFEVDPLYSLVRLLLIIMGVALIWLGYKHVLEPLIMVPMGLGMTLVNAGTLMLPGERLGNLFVNPIAEEPSEIVEALQIYFLQPFYTLTFTNNLIACLIFLGVGAMTDIEYLIARPLLSMALAIAAELGTLVTFPIAVALGFNFKEAAAIAIIGGADGPMVIYTSIMLAKHLFVIITVVAYLYLSIIYMLYPFLIKAMVPKRLRGIEMPPLYEIQRITPREKFIFTIALSTVLCLLFPVAAPLFACFFLGVAIKEINIPRYKEVADLILSGSTMFLGFVLGCLLSADVVLNPKVSLIALLGIIAIILSGVGGLAAGLLAYKISKGRVNPLVGVAAVSCIPSTAKIAQYSAKEANPMAMILPHAMGASVGGVITTGILAGFYITICGLLG